MRTSLGCLNVGIRFVGIFSVLVASWHALLCLYFWVGSVGAGLGGWATSGRGRVMPQGGNNGNRAGGKVGVILKFGGVFIMEHYTSGSNCGLPTREAVLFECRFYLAYFLFRGICRIKKKTRQKK